MARNGPRQQKKTAALKRYRKLYSQAKRKGLVKGNLSATLLKPSAYMRRRLRDLEPYLGKDYVVVKASPELEKTWRKAPSEIVPRTFNRKLLVKRAPGVKVSTKDGILSLRRKLAAGEFEELPLPVTARSINDLREWIQSNRYYNDILKHREEVFNFKIYGNPSFNNFGDLEALIEELEKYKNFDEEDWGDDAEFFKNFALFRSYKDWKWERDTPVYKARAAKERRTKGRERKLARMTPEKRAEFLERENQKRRSRRMTQQSYSRELEARKSARRDETDEQREERLTKQRTAKRKHRAKRTT